MSHAAFRLYVPVYTVTLILSAFLLFAVQPMYGKLVLPMLGGTPQVWNTAMMFFQAMLLAGYGYAHLSSRFLNLKAQAGLHIILMMAFIIMLPIALPAGWVPPQTANPMWWQLGLMTISVGGPFFILAASAPIIQRWFSYTDHPDAQNPYFLYAASNLGSMSALLAYPVLIEPGMSVSLQGWAWAAGYLLLIACFAGAAMLVWGRHKAQAENAGAAALPDVPPTWGRRLAWIGLAFVPSSLMLGLTTYITTDLAAVPLLWVIPLALYIGTFIIVFARSFRLPTWPIIILHTVLLMFVISSLMFEYISNTFVAIGLHTALFFISALLCHQRLADLRPAPSHLTEFYLLMSFGGVLGGIFNSIVAPSVFPMPIEYALVLGLAAFARFAGDDKQPLSVPFIRASLFKSAVVIAVIVMAAVIAMIKSDDGSMLMVMTMVSCVMLASLWTQRFPFAVAAVIVLALHPGLAWRAAGDMIYMDRNYFGFTKVSNSENQHSRLLLHGTTVHGAQPYVEQLRLVPVTYYHPGGPVGDLFNTLSEKAAGPQRIGALGLGVGSIACYRRDGRIFDFYEIDPDVQRIAEDRALFTYLSDCGSPYQVIIGDGRLRMEDAASRAYDMIFLDAFSSDNIPVHTITLEAFDLYREKLKTDGIIAINISNRYLDLRPVLDKVAKETGMTLLFREGDGELLMAPELRSYRTIYGAFTRDANITQALIRRGWAPANYEDRNTMRPWTDDYANPFGTLWMNSPKPSSN